MIDLSTYGKPLHLLKPVVGRVAFEPVTRPEESVLVTPFVPDDFTGFKALITTARIEDPETLRLLPLSIPPAKSRI